MPNYMIKKPVSLEVLLAFGFGVVFCGVLAYAGLRERPITDPGQLWIFRVLASISAAGVAAVIPGMLDIRIGKGKLFAIRGAGALGVFVLIYTVNPPELIRPATESMRATMSGNYSQGFYNDANRIADKILRNEPNDAQALNIKGGISFYREDFDSAVEYFRKAHLSKPNYTQYISNYANALIEVNAYAKALELFQSINDGTRDRSYGLGRAQFYSGNFEEAGKNLETVPLAYWHGAARMLEAAALVAIAQRQSNPIVRAELESTAKRKFHEAYAVDQLYWNGILSGTEKDKHQGYNKAVALVTPFFMEETVSR